jgi:FKBP-type peptidyl-prolyl cis-trans isomerase FkpA
MKKLLAFILLITVFTGCQTYSENDKAKFDKDIRAYLKKQNKKCQRTPSGLYYTIIHPGEGEFIRYKDIVSFTYTGKFLSGETFDVQKKPVEFEVSKLILGWKEVMFELKPGAKVFMVLPPQLAYGDRKLDDIPPHSTLVYEMEIIGVK